MENGVLLFRRYQRSSGNKLVIRMLFHHSSLRTLKINPANKAAPASPIYSDHKRESSRGNPLDISTNYLYGTVKAKHDHLGMSSQIIQNE